MVMTCEIKFDNNPSLTFASGSMLTGRVIINSTEKKKVRCKLMNNEQKSEQFRFRFC
jgi:hypothetical protein